jgi:Na+-translocating ferredoxin:NAD+ oxidoreductase RnfG subunit
MKTTAFLGGNIGYVNTKITLKNFDDAKQARRDILPEEKIRQATIDVMVETVKHKLIGAHGDHPMYLAKQFK